MPWTLTMLISICQCLWTAVGCLKPVPFDDGPVVDQRRINPAEVNTRHVVAGLTAQMS